MNNRQKNIIGISSQNGSKKISKTLLISALRFSSYKQASFCVSWSKIPMVTVSYSHFHWKRPFYWFNCFQIHASVNPFKTMSTSKPLAIQLMTILIRVNNFRANCINYDQKIIGFIWVCVVHFGLTIWLPQRDHFGSHWKFNAWLKWRKPQSRTEGILTYYIVHMHNKNCINQ